MGMFDFVKVMLGRFPSSEWQAAPSLALEYDFDRQTLAGVRIASMMNQFSRFGPAEDASRALYGVLLYYSKGLQLCLEQERVMDFVFYFYEGWDGRHASEPFTGKFKVRGREVKLDGDTTEAQVVELFGTPKRREADEDEVIVYYVLNGLEHEFEFSTDGTLTALSVTGE